MKELFTDWAAKITDITLGTPDSCQPGPGARRDMVEQLQECLEDYKTMRDNLQDVTEERDRLNDAFIEAEAALEFLNKMESKYEWDKEAIEDFLDCIHAHGIPDSIELDTKLSGT